MRLLPEAVIFGLRVWLVSLLLGMLGGSPASAADVPRVSIIPVPKQCQLRNGTMAITPQSRVVAMRADLLPVARVVAGDMERLIGLKPDVAEQSPRTGDIVLQIDPELKNESYAVEVGEMATIRAGNKGAVAHGTVIVLQAISQTDAGAAVPHMTVEDEPAVEYRGLMIDCARYWQSPRTLKQMVNLCRWYKIRYLHLHLTDDQAFTFPSTAMPELPNRGMHYTLEELRELETYTQDRGITIIPEMDVPGHAKSLVQALPKLFGTNPLPAPNDHFQTICVVRNETYEALDTLIGEMCEVFRATPYFHLGADEVLYPYWEKCVDTKAYMAAQKLDNMDELYRHFIVRMNEIVKKHGKQTLVWEGFAKEGKIDIPRDIVVQAFECKYNLPPDLLADGYQIINTAWVPLYVCDGDPKYMWPPEYIYGWNHYRWENWTELSKAYKNPITVEPTSNVLGAQMCVWQQDEKFQVPTLRQRLPAMSERIWNPEAGRSFADFLQRLKSTDAGLEKLLKIE